MIIDVAIPANIEAKATSDSNSIYMASGRAKVSKEGWNPYLQTEVCPVPGKSRMSLGGENIPGDVGEDGVSVAASQSHATWGFTCEINPDLFPHNKMGKIGMNVTLSPGHLTKETGQLTSLQPRLKLTSLQIFKGRLG